LLRLWTPTILHSYAKVKGTFVLISRNLTVPLSSLCFQCHAELPDAFI
jgi:hypothetical protein